ncbi:glycosyltransferase family 4 protein [Oceanidesulfovibrio marinus]|uniref:Glycosyl transferase family 1 n=1 Tax=Oceanidesulfovibrio marinus TaxID=370038 RepID=A0A6P1ZLA4_9BACT|nr:glycosyltransferase family 4 protein [Oceanidesulfovibrio marinus]QJT09795.1 glycosyltransferase [Oceanidesulfovibrio marinus]TVM36090.1 glycosyl transferase family 1 [Oceanidesulfovibrio marinus]
MRILHFYKSAYPDSTGGIETAIHQIAKGVAAYGVRSDVLALSRDQNRIINFDEYDLHLLKADLEIASTRFSLRSLQQFMELSKSADVIHYHFPWPFMDLVHFISRTRKPSIVTYHSDIVRQKKLLLLYSPLMMKFLGRVDRIVSTSPNYSATSNILQRFQEKVVNIPIGIDRDSYPVPSEEGVQRWKDKFGSRFFLFVGVLRYYKGLHILLEAAKNTDFPIVIVGSGPIEQELKGLADRLGLRNIHFLGWVNDEDKVALMNACYAVVFPSHLRSEAFGISLLEGAMFGKPLLSSEIGSGMSYINIHGETGIVVPPSDPGALREAMLQLWDNPDLAAEMGSHAQQRYSTLFTADIMASNYVDLYNEVAS